VRPEAPSDRENRLRDVGSISFLVGLLALAVSFALLFTGPPQRDLATAGGVLTAVGAGALAIRYRFAAILLVCFLTPIALVTALVAWPPVIFVLLALPVVWVVVKRRRRSPTGG
jgi:hypothetical protein